MTAATGCPIFVRNENATAGKSVNYYVRPPLGDKPVQDSDYEREVQEVMNMWYIRYDVNLDPKTVIYEDTSIFMEWFANVGCSHNFFS
ncbi:hypothetical protein Y032_0010g1005 [Ancylostoma ceylanicum]|uniref:Uncharacterized protein n=1 Tax=Ancylostoma ceylanicum TaxID=53326 RepID=A0A016VHE8_9BILA|nr:hypothetical protein Y032_0010g1005 [Ancylostoma ceylanicum]